MEHDEDDIEDGQISDGADDYTLVQRPIGVIKAESQSDIFSKSTSATKMDDTSEHDDHDDCYSEDFSEQSSDSSKPFENVYVKKKKKPNIKHIKSSKKTLNSAGSSTSLSQSATKNNKFNLWSAALQEETLLENLKGCEVNQNGVAASSIKVKRSVESYSYTLAYCLDKEKTLKRRYSNSIVKSETSTTKNDSFNNKRFCCNDLKRKSVKSVRSRLGHKANDESTHIDAIGDETSRSSSNSNGSSSGKDAMFHSRSILDLNLLPNCTNDDIARDIANKLYEQKDDLLLRIVNTLGKELSIQLFKETQNIESSGGMLIMNRERRRTPGGVFLFLLKHNEDVTKEQIKEIFLKETKQTVQTHKKKQRIKRNEKVEHLRKSLIVESDSPILSARSEIIVSRLNPETTPNLSNPPPSPVTDCNRENSSDFDVHDIQHVNITTPDKANLSNSCEEDFIDMNCDDMDLL